MKGTEKQIEWANDIIDKKIIPEIESYKKIYLEDYECDPEMVEKAFAEVEQILRDKDAKEIIDARFSTGKLLDDTMKATPYFY